jgi:hypothetical protein
MISRLPRKEGLGQVQGRIQSRDGGQVRPRIEMFQDHIAETIRAGVLADMWGGGRSGGTGRSG